MNLETSLISKFQKSKNVCIGVNEDAFKIIPDTVQIISLVNNHIWDSGDPTSLKQLLESFGKKVVGPANPSKLQVNIDGMDVGFFSAYFGLPRFRVSFNGIIADELEQMLLNSVAEFKIVNLHWGYEHTDVPAPFQRDIAYRFIDAGAEIIIGHHPHVPQGWEVYKEKYIFYSLGNFNFWQFAEKPTDNNRWGYMVKYDLDSGNVEPIPYKINENYQPCNVTQEETIKLSENLQGLSERLLTINDKIWFKTEYSGWYSREIKVWKRRFKKTLSIRILFMWLIWLILPMQLKFYVNNLKSIVLK